MTKEEPVNKLCEDCRQYKAFGKECFFYWDRKKECSNHTKGNNGPAVFKKVEYSQ